MKYILTDGPIVTYSHDITNLASSSYNYYLIYEFLRSRRVYICAGISGFVLHPEASPRS